MGRMIVIEGLDGSGKSTQIELLKKYFQQVGCSYKQIKLPDYEDPSSTLVRMYLGGAFGKKPEDVGAFAASAFFAVDLQFRDEIRHLLNLQITLLDHHCMVLRVR